jgi:hypothetical protein
LILLDSGPYFDAMAGQCLTQFFLELCFELLTDHFLVSHLTVILQYADPIIVSVIFKLFMDET